MSVLVEFDRRGLKDEWQTDRRSHEYVYNLHIYAELGYSMYSGMEHLLLFIAAIVMPRRSNNLQDCAQFVSKSRIFDYETPNR